MKLQVNIFEARGLAARDPDGLSDPYVRVQLGRTKSSTSVVHKSLNPVWNEEFSFRVDDLTSELVISVWDEACFTDGFLGQVKLSVSKVLHADKLTLPPTWYPLQTRSTKSKAPVSGEILISASFYGKDGKFKMQLDSDAESIPNSPASRLAPASPFSNQETHKGHRSRLGEKFSKFFSKKKKNKIRIHPNPSSSSPSTDLGEYSGTEEGDDSGTEDDSEVPISFFEGDGEPMVTTGEDFPPPLSGGILLDQTYAATVRELNAILFKPGSAFYHELATVQKTTDLEEGPWKKVGNENPKRIVTYTKAATKLVKAMKATEEQVYLHADERGYVVLVSVSTPEVTYGNSFRTEIQFRLTPASVPEQSHLCVSWRINFLQNVMLKGVIENGAKQGLKDSYKQYAEILAKYVKLVDGEEEDSNHSEADQTGIQPKTDWELFKEFMMEPRVIITMLLSLYVILHMYLAKPREKTGLEFWEIHLPDSLCEFATSAFLTLQLEKIVTIAVKKLRARICVAGDHGIKAKGEGWLLTVTLVEGENLPTGEDSTWADPYVVFTCSGKTRTSSVKLQTSNPKWGEIFEFDATEDPPSTMDVEVFNYDGPFPEAQSLGFAEINFLKSRPEELADLWVNLEGNEALKHGSRLHLRIFLTNTKETDTIVEYVKKVEKEVGTKIMNRSHKNASFQKLFSLPAEEFLINDFACAIKRKIPLQGRLFLSPRMLGFYSNIFGHKTKFSILWEDIEEIQELPPSLANVGPSLVLYTRKGRAHDANQGAKNLDAKGRLKFQFQSFVRPGPAFRTVKVLWRNRALSPEQQLELVESAEAESRFAEAGGQPDDSGDFIGVDDPQMKEVYYANLPFTASSLSLIYHQENMEEKVMEKLGCINYTVSPWESTGRPNLQQRQVNYRFNRQLCQFGSVVSGVQQKEVSENEDTFAVDEILTLHDVPFGDNFQIHVRIVVKTTSTKPPTSCSRVYLGIAWQKGTSMKERITSNVYEQYTKHLKYKLQLTGQLISSYKDRHAYVLV